MGRSLDEILADEKPAVVEAAYFKADAILLDIHVSELRHRQGKTRIDLAADEQHLPFSFQVPTPATSKAMGEMEAGKGKRFETADDLFQDLGLSKL